MYGLHPSDELVELFRRSPFQGANPESASVIFVGIDANYSEQISTTKFFRRIIEYQKDAVSFWKKYGVHHPFLLESYPLKKNTGGVPYHRNFAALQIPIEFADQISFIELLDVPTTGNSSGNDAIFWKLFNPKHSERIDAMLRSETKKVVFVSDGVIRRMRKIRRRFGHFSFIPDHDRQGKLFDNGSTEIHKVFHFSDNRIHSQIRTIRDLIFESSIA